MHYLVGIIRNIKQESIQTPNKRVCENFSVNEVFKDK